MTDHLVELEGIEKRYGRFKAVNGVSMAVKPGEIFGFLGPNGAGKTTVIRILLDILQPDRGRRQVLGAESALSVGDRIGYLPEERGLYKAMTPVNAITYFARLKGMKAAHAKERARELLERYGLSAVADKPIKTFSKGMAQKVQVLSCVAHDPEVVILDEPFSGLDPVNQQVLEELICALRDAGRTVIFSTHVMQHAERLCDRVIMIGRGETRFLGTVDEARARLPRRLRLTTDSTASALPALPGLEKVAEADGHATYETRLAAQQSVQQILKQCLDSGVDLSGFTVIEPTLHDVFVDLVGEDARQARTAA
ncbi:ABC transporter ATP-binding protein [Rhodothalassium salexigens]|uniref:ABC transporter ATP-binding protein n=1 Tax=Rhodothalassium salexigens TaxID=1086 RepID=UPI001804A36A|nr:ATP-binding cassette domain-containing protein [Rhodothalassium salexigens]MBB4212633.1 ABC-2 type transport system ATP-binding protein [Rhodothalassium salexigens DSM 2132]